MKGNTQACWEKILWKSSEKGVNKDRSICACLDICVWACVCGRMCVCVCVYSSASRSSSGRGSFQ